MVSITLYLFLLISCIFNICDGQLNAECASVTNEWYTVKGEKIQHYGDESCGKTINSLSGDSINVMAKHQWKTCNPEEKFIVEMTYSTSNPSEDSRTGIVIYPHSERDRDDENNGGFHDHYFIRLHPKNGKGEAEVHVGYYYAEARDGKEAGEHPIESRYGLKYEWNDGEWEKLRVEVSIPGKNSGNVFDVYLNDELLLHTGLAPNPFNLNTEKPAVMSGYVGIQSIKGDINIQSIYTSGEEVYDHDDIQDYMYECQFVDDSDVDAVDDEQDDTTAPTPAPTNVPTTTTTTEAPTPAPTTTPSPPTNVPTTSTPTASSAGGDGNEPEPDDDPTIHSGAEANVDTNTALTDADEALGGPEVKHFIVYTIIGLIICCIIIVAIYYIRLNKQRHREQQLQNVFGRQSVRISRSNDEIADIIAEAHAIEGRSVNAMSPGLSTFDENTTRSPPRHSRSQSGMIHVVDGFDRPSTVWNNNALHHNQSNNHNQRGPYGHHHYYAGDEDNNNNDKEIMGTWDVEALEMDCNNIIKNNRLHNRAYSQ